MPLDYLLDENLRGLLWTAMIRHNLDAEFPIDALRVGDPSDLPLGSGDPEILIWCERNGRILVSADKSTLDSHLRRHLTTGSHSPGIFLIKPQASLSSVVEFLWIAAHASDPDEWRDRTWFVP
jgi:hypothetical protein